MTGEEAAEVVRQLCLAKGHEPNASGSGWLVCVHCREVMQALRDKHKPALPAEPTVSVHFVINPQTGLFATELDDALANDQARAIRGLVVSVPVSSDWRAPNPKGQSS